MSAIHQLPQQPATLTQVVAQNIRAECGRQDMTQTDLAAAMGVNRTTVTRRWRGERQWQLEDLEQVAAVLHVEPWQLLRSARPEGFEPPTSWLGVSGAEIVDLNAERERRTPSNAGPMTRHNAQA